MANSGYSTETTLAAMALASSCGGDMERIRPGLQTAIDNALRSHKSELDLAINMACGELSDGKQVRILLENGCGDVDFINMYDGEDYGIGDTADMSFAEKIVKAVDMANDI